MKAMLACSTQPVVANLDYPMYASAKLDGIRCLAIGGKAYSRNMKLIPNHFVQQYFAKHKLHGLDGELLVEGDFNSVQSGIMSESGTPEFNYHVFDYFVEPDKFFSSRQDDLSSLFKEVAMGSRVLRHPQVKVAAAEDVQRLYEGYVYIGFEGLILRHQNGKYKYGRSTLKQQWMLKLKPVEDAEAKIVGYAQLMRNMDTSTKQKENMVGVPMLGAFKVEAFGKQFEVGSGFDNAQRSTYWTNRDNLVGKYITFKYQELSKYGVPRFPVFKGFRNEGDI